jgi:hypothetical protein
MILELRKSCNVTLDVINSHLKQNFYGIFSLFSVDRKLYGELVNQTFIVQENFDEKILSHIKSSFLFSSSSITVFSILI